MRLNVLKKEHLKGIDEKIINKLRKPELLKMKYIEDPSYTMEDVPVQKVDLEALVFNKNSEKYI